MIFEAPFTSDDMTEDLSKLAYKEDLWEIRNLTYEWIWHSLVG